jgi:uncharacterized repeat protein (TIGR01451 family)
VGALNEDEDATGGNTINNSGSAYIFEKSQNGDWQEIQKIVAPDRGNTDNFGISVAISDEVVVVGSYLDDKDEFGNTNISNAGSAYIYEKNTSNIWSFSKKLISTTASPNDHFGWSVAVSGNQVLVGSHQNNGSAFLYYKRSNNLWELTKNIYPYKTYNNTSFGYSVALSGNYILIGSYKDYTDEVGENQRNEAGATYYFCNKGVVGKIFKDINENCQIDENENGIIDRTVILNPGNISLKTGHGYWYIDSLPSGTYTITADTTGKWKRTCPLTQTFTIAYPDSFYMAPSFGFVSTEPCAEPDISITMPFMRPGFSNQKIYVKACNQYKATGALTNAYVVIELDPQLTPQSGSQTYTSLGNNQYRFNIGNLNPGVCKDFWIACSLSVNATLGETLCMKANLFPQDSCVFDTIPDVPTGVTPCTLPWDKSSLKVEGTCVNDSIRFVIYNTGQAGGGDMQCYAPVRIYVDGVLISLDSILIAGGDSVVIMFAGDGRTWRLEADQHPLHPGRSRPNATVENCGSGDWTPNLVNNLPHNDLDPIVDIYCGVVTGSYDPNDKRGFPLGITENHHIMPNQDIEYLIRFQNTGTDTAFTVIITDTLDTDLDIFSVISGVSSHNYKFRMHGPRVLEWRFYNILLPDSNVNEPASNGFVTFKVKQHKNLANGTLITNTANIYFDFNAPIITNTSLHTVDDGVRTVVSRVETRDVRQKTKSLKVYPNPATNQLTVSSAQLAKGAGVEIYNAMGVLVKYLILNPSPKEKDFVICYRN